MSRLFFQSYKQRASPHHQHAKLSSALKLRTSHLKKYACVISRQRANYIIAPCQICWHPQQSSKVSTAQLLYKILKFLFCFELRLIRFVSQIWRLPNSPYYCSHFGSDYGSVCFSSVMALQSAWDASYSFLVQIF